MGVGWPRRATLSPLPSAGAFSLLRENFSHAPSPDMSPASLSMLEQLMTAQAQECVFEGLLLQAPVAPRDCLAQLHLAQEAAQVRAGSPAKLRCLSEQQGLGRGCRPELRSRARIWAGVGYRASCRAPEPAVNPEVLSPRLWGNTNQGRNRGPAPELSLAWVRAAGTLVEAKPQGGERWGPGPLGSREAPASCRVRQQVAAEYRLVHQTMAQPPVQDYVPFPWTTLVHVKAEYFRALAHYHAALALCDGARECPAPHARVPAGPRRRLTALSDPQRWRRRSFQPSSRSSSGSRPRLSPGAPPCPRSRRTAGSWVRRLREGRGAGASAGVNAPLHPVIPSPDAPALAGGVPSSPGAGAPGVRAASGGGGGTSHTRRQFFRGSDLPSGPQDEPRSPRLPSSRSTWWWGSWGPAWKGQAGSV